MSIFFLYVTAEDVKIHLKVLRDLYMRKTKPEAKKSGSGYEHLPVRMQHIIDRLKFLEPSRHVGRPTQSTLARLEESNVQPMKPTQPKRKKAKSTSSESEWGSDESASGSDSGSKVKSHLIFSLVELLTLLAVLAVLNISYCSLYSLFVIS